VSAFEHCLDLYEMQSTDGSFSNFSYSSVPMNDYSTEQTASFNYAAMSWMLFISSWLLEARWYKKSRHW